MQKSLIQELKRDLSPEKLKILNLLLVEMELCDEQLQHVRSETRYLDQMRQIDEIMELDEKKAA